MKIYFAGVQMRKSVEIQSSVRKNRQDNKEGRKIP